MASRLTVLYYDDVSDTKSDHQWRELTNRIANPGYDDNNAISASNRPFRYGGGSPVIDCNINDRFGSQMEMKLTLGNSGARHSKDWTGSEELGQDPLANGQISQYNGLLPEFTRIIVHEASTYMTLFVGRIYVVEDKFEFPQGNILRLTCRDGLEEVSQADLSSSSAITMVTGGNGVGNYPTTISRQLDVIKEIVRQTVYGGGTNEQEISFVDHKIDKGLSHIRGFTEKDISDNPEVKLKTWGQTSPLKIIQNLANLEKWQTGDIDHFGFGFFLDATRTVPYYKITSAINGEGILPQDFTYFRKGYYPTASPATYGLNVTYAQSASINETPSGSSDDRTRNMFNDFNFGGFADSSVTHISLYHKGHGEVGADDVTSHSGDDALNDSTWNKMGGKPGEQSDMRWGGTYDGSVGVKLDGPLYDHEDLLTILYIKPLSGNSTVGDFSWKTGNANYSGSSDQWKHQRSFRQVSSLHKYPVGSQTNVPSYRYTGDGGTKTWLGNVQFQGVDGDGNNFLILSNPQEDIINDMIENAILYESSTITPLSGCRFDYYPAKKRRAKRTVSRAGSDYGTGSNYGLLRNGIAHEFLGSNNKQTDRMRKGFFRISDWPHMRWSNTAGSGSTGVTLKPFVGANTVSDFGMRVGNSITSTDNAGVRYVGFISAIDDTAKTVSSYMFKQSEIDDDSTGSLTYYAWAQNDPYNIYVSLRTGMTIRVDNKLALTIGDHIITSINYSWANGHVSSEITTVGINDESLFQSRDALKQAAVPNVKESSEPRVIDAMSLAANAYEARGIMWWHSHIYGATPTLASASLRDYNSFSWSGGSIIVHATGNKYQINPGNTDAQLTYAGYTSPMQANIQYVLYLDRDFPSSNARYDIRIAQVTHDDDGYMRAPSFLEMAYLTIGEDEDAGEKTIGVPGSSFYSVTIPFLNGMPNIQFMNTFSNVLGVDDQLVQAGRILQPNSLTTSLLKKGAGRPWASNLSIRGTAYNAIVFDNGSASTDATLTFGNGDTVTITDGTRTGIGDNTTTYMYLDGTSAGLTGSLAPQFTTNHAIAHGDNKLLMAVIAVGVATQGDKPNILPFNSKQMTINGGVIAADAIIADHVRATTLTTDLFTSSAQTDILNSNSDRARTFAQDNPPTSVTIGDLWADTNDTVANPKLYRSTQAGSAAHWVRINDNSPEFTADVNQIFRQEGITGSGSTYNNIPTSINVGDIWIDTDDNAMYFALSIGATTIVTSGTTGWMRRDDVDAINNAITTIKGGLINTQKIILKDGGGSNPVILQTGTGSSQSTARIELDNYFIKGYSTATTVQFEISAADGRGRFGGGDVIADSTGLHIATGNSNVIHFGTYGSEDFFIQRYSGPSGAALRLGGTQSSNVEVVGSLVPGIVQGSGGSYLGRDTNVNTAFKGIWLWDSTTTPVNGEAGPKFLTYSTANSRLEFDGAAIGGGGGSGTITSGDTGYVAYYTGATTIDSKISGGIQFVDSTNIKIYAHTNLGGYSLKFEETGSGTDSITITAPYSGVTSYTLTLPTTDGGANQVLKTNGSGVLDWVDQSAGGRGDISAVLAGDGIAVSGGSSGDATVSVAQSFDPVWTGTHAWTGTATFGNTVNVNAKTQLNQDVDIGDSNADTVLIKAKVGGGSFGAPGITFSNDTGFWTNDASKIFWTANSQTSGHGYLKSDGTNDSIFANGGSFGWTLADNHYGSDTGSASDCTFTWNGYLTYGMYYNSGHVSIAAGGNRRFTVADAGTYHYGGNVYIDDLPTTSYAVNIRKGTNDFLYILSSTLKSKINIRDLEIDTSKVYLLEPKTFEMRNQYKDENDRWAYGDTPTDTAFGMIAEEVYPIFPDLINLDKEGDPQSINYDMLSVLLLSELKKLKARIEVLEGD